MTRTRTFQLRSLTLLLIMILLGAALLARSVAAQSTPDYVPIDIERDADGDGVPDELAEEVHIIIQLIETHGFTEQTHAAIQELAARIPCSDETRALRQQAIALSEQLLETEDRSEAEALVRQLRVLDSQIMADPDYARGLAAIETILANHTFHQSSDGTTIDTSRNYLPLIFSSGSSSGGDGGDGGADVDALALDRGNILLIDGTGSSSGSGWNDFVYKVEWGHAGVVDFTGEDGTNIYESNADGVTLRDFDESWRQTGNRIWEGQAQDAETRENVVTSLEAAKERYGTDGRTPYNYNLADKQTDEALYCSQLAWKIYGGADIDIDSNDTEYAATMDYRWGLPGVTVAIFGVAPDEIARDNDLDHLITIEVQ